MAGLTTTSGTFAPAEARVALLRRALEMQPGSPTLLHQLAEALADAGCEDEFAATFARAFQLDPRASLLTFERVAAAKDEAAVMLRARMRALLRRGVAVTPVIAALAVMEAVVGDFDEVARLVDYGRFFHRQLVASPQLGAGDFHAAFAAEIRDGLKHRQVGWDHINEARRNNHVMTSALPASAAFARAMRREVEHYKARIGSDPANPFTASSPDEFDLSGWSVLLDGESRHVAHIHPRAWAVGVYYVVQPEVSRDATAKRGWLRVGIPHEFAARRDTPWPEIWVEPKPGTLVLMPGYFYHETTAMRVDEERISVAFEVTPRGVVGP